MIPHLAGLGRCLAPDLVGMGRSGTPAGDTPRFLDHARYLDAWFDQLGLTPDVILVLHDWGSALGFHRAAGHASQVAGIAYMEAIIAPLQWDDFGGPRGDLFRAIRSERGEQMILDENLFVEMVLPRGVIRTLGDREMEAYRAPFANRASRLPTLLWPRQLPIDGQPADVVSIVERYGAWLSQSACPKLLILAEPGAVVTGRLRDVCRAWPNQTEVTVKGRHFLQEDSPDEIGAALAVFVKRVRRDASQHHPPTAHP